MEYPSVLPLLFLLLLPSPSTSVNVTSVLRSFPELSRFTDLLIETSVADDLLERSSLTLLAVPNSVLRRLPNSSGGPFTSSPYGQADVIRYHVLLQYLSPADLRLIPPEGKLVTTLFQTTGRAPANWGAVNLTRDVSTGSIVARSPAPFSSSNATVVSLVKTLPYNVSIFSVDAVLVPNVVDLAASENRPPASVNITQVLADGGDFNVATSMLEGSGVVEEFEADERGAGITLFVPTDEAFAALPPGGVGAGEGGLQSLPAERKAVVLRFHVLHSYYPLGSLESIVNPVQPTLATESTGAGRFTLNITRVNGSVAIDTGIVQATITRTVFDQNPVAVFAVSRVLLPREIFRKDEAPVVVVDAPPPLTGVGFAPRRPPLADPPAVGMPSALEREVGSGVGMGKASTFGSPWWWWLCIGCSLYLLVINESHVLGWLVGSFAIPF